MNNEVASLSIANRVPSSMETENSSRAVEQPEQIQQQLQQQLQPEQLEQPQSGPPSLSKASSDLVEPSGLSASQRIKRILRPRLDRIDETDDGIQMDRFDNDAEEGGEGGEAVAMADAPPKLQRKPTEAVKRATDEVLEKLKRAARKAAVIAKLQQSVQKGQNTVGLVSEIAGSDTPFPFLGSAMAAPFLFYLRTDSGARPPPIILEALHINITDSEQAGESQINIQSHLPRLPNLPPPPLIQSSNTAANAAPNINITANINSSGSNAGNVPAGQDLFRIELRYGEVSWVIYRRLYEFLYLHTMLIWRNRVQHSIKGNLPSFPSQLRYFYDRAKERHVNSFIDNVGSAFMSRRNTTLNNQPSQTHSHSRPQTSGSSNSGINSNNNRPVTATRKEQAAVGLIPSAKPAGRSIFNRSSIDIENNTRNIHELLNRGNNNHLNDNEDIHLSLDAIGEQQQQQHQQQQQLQQQQQQTVVNIAGGAAERRRVQLEQYVRELLRVLNMQTCFEICEFLEISSVSISSGMGWKGKEMNVMRRISSNSTSWIGKIKDFLFPHWKSQWILVRDSFVALCSTVGDPYPRDIIMVDSSFKISEANIRGGHDYIRGHRIVISNEMRSLELRGSNERHMSELLNSLKYIVNNSKYIGEHPHDSFAPVRPNSQVRYFVDGEDYFSAVADAIMLATETVFIEDWWLSPELYLKRPPRDNEQYRIDNLLLYKAQQGVKIYIVVYKEVRISLTIDSRHTKRVLSQLHKNIHVQRHPDVSSQTLYWAHHEKIVVVDSTIAFIGGLDLCYGRYDRRSHRLVDYYDDTGKAGGAIVYNERDVSINGGGGGGTGNGGGGGTVTICSEGPVRPDIGCSEIWFGQDYCNPRVKDFVQVDKFDLTLIKRHMTPRMPWHDVSMGVTGTAALDVARHFIQRWNHIKHAKAVNKRHFPLLLPKGEGELNRKHFDLFKGSCNAQALRSSSMWSLGINDEHSIQNAYISNIEKAQHFIYIENQFFITASTSVDSQNGTIIHNMIGEALFKRILKAHRNNEKFRVIVLMPLMPAFEGDISESAAATLRLVMHFQYRSIDRDSNGKVTSLFGRLRELGINPFLYIQFFGLRTWDIIRYRFASSDAAEKQQPVTSDLISSSPPIMPGAINGYNNANTNSNYNENEQDLIEEVDSANSNSGGHVKVSKLHYSKDRFKMLVNLISQKSPMKPILPIDSAIHTSRNATATATATGTATGTTTGTGTLHAVSPRKSALRQTTHNFNTLSGLAIHESPSISAAHTHIHETSSSGDEDVAELRASVQISHPEPAHIRNDNVGDIPHPLAMSSRPTRVRIMDKPQVFGVSRRLSLDGNYSDGYSAGGDDDDDDDDDDDIEEEEDVEEASSAPDHEMSKSTKWRKRGKKLRNKISEKIHAVGNKLHSHAPSDDTATTTTTTATAGVNPAKLHHRTMSTTSSSMSLNPSRMNHSMPALNRRSTISGPTSDILGTVMDKIGLNDERRTKITQTLKQKLSSNINNSSGDDDGNGNDDSSGADADVKHGRLNNPNDDVDSDSSMEMELRNEMRRARRKANVTATNNIGRDNLHPDIQHQLIGGGGAGRGGAMGFAIPVIPSSDDVEPKQERQRHRPRHRARHPHHQRRHSSDNINVNIGIDNEHSDDLSSENDGADHPKGLKRHAVRQTVSKLKDEIKEQTKRLIDAATGTHTTNTNTNSGTSTTAAAASTATTAAAYIGGPASINSAAGKRHSFISPATSASGIHYPKYSTHGADVLPSDVSDPDDSRLSPVHAPELAIPPRTSLDVSRSSLAISSSSPYSMATQQPQPRPEFSSYLDVRPLSVFAPDTFDATLEKLKLSHGQATVASAPATSDPASAVEPPLSQPQLARPPQRHAFKAINRRAGLDSPQLIPHYSEMPQSRVTKTSTPRSDAASASPSPSPSPSAVATPIDGTYHTTIVTEEVYIHTKLMIIDDRVVIMGSANINDRSMCGNRDSEIAMVIEDTNLIDSKMNGNDYKVGKFAHKLRMDLCKEHIGLLPTQHRARNSKLSLRDKLLNIANGIDESSLNGSQSSPSSNNGSSSSNTVPLMPDSVATPLPKRAQSHNVTVSSTSFSSSITGNDEYSELHDCSVEYADDIVRDPLDDKFWKKWCGIANSNTLLFREVFHCVPDDTISTWSNYRSFVSTGVPYGHAIDTPSGTILDFPDDASSVGNGNGNGNAKGNGNGNGVTPARASSNPSPLTNLPANGNNSSTDNLGQQQQQQQQQASKRRLTPAQTGTLLTLNKLAAVHGNLVEFPLNFLREEDLGVTLLNKEYLVSSDVFT